MKRITVLALIGFASVTAGTPAFADTIDTRGSYAGKIDYLGAGYTPTYGQTFTVGPANALNGFTFFLGGGATNVRAYVYSWGGHGVLGHAHYTSDVRSFGGTDGDAYQALRFDVGAIDLRPGQRYVAFLTTAGIDQPANGGVTWMPTAGDFGSNAYAGGDFVYTNAGDSLDAVVGKEWDDSNGVFGDVQFQADFSVGATSGAGVPEPAAWALLIGGFGIAGSTLRLRRARAGQLKTG
ncbi:PEPxxWA-CTERM sorting domain-containing protein [Sphingomonas sp.]|uniref:PEPxxWA-CTERM sorting domain-containing protein n=1 Tax=Sphingomonas sp. TaxID=28214 RepID=UPI002FDAFC4F